LGSCACPCAVPDAGARWPRPLPAAAAPPVIASMPAPVAALSLYQPSTADLEAAQRLTRRGPQLSGLRGAGQLARSARCRRQLRAEQEHETSRREQQRHAAAVLAAAATAAAAAAPSRFRRAPQERPSHRRPTPGARRGVSGGLLGRGPRGWLRSVGAKGSAATRLRADEPHAADHALRASALGRPGRAGSTRSG
jgi:hypothetical protein